MADPGPGSSRTVPPGDSILVQGQPSDSLYVVASGSVRAFRNGEPMVLTMGPGESFGQLLLVDGGPSELSAVAVERTDLLVVPAAALRDRLAGNAEAGYALFRALARSLAARLRRVVGALELARGMD
jgi:CRP/FNR family transcriptional regulator, cyclic AMP receptor protein